MSRAARWRSSPSCSCRCCSRPWPTSSRSRRHGARPVSSRSRSRSPAGWACCRSWPGLRSFRSRSPPGCSSRSCTRATSSTCSRIPRPPGSSGSRSSAHSGRSSSAWSVVAGPRSRKGRHSPLRHFSRRSSAVASRTGDVARRPRSRPSRRGSCRRRVPRSRPRRSCTRIPRRASGSRPTHRCTSPSLRRATSPTPAENRPYERAEDARRFQRTGDLAIPESYDAEYLVVDGLRGERSFDLPVVYEDDRFVLYRLPPSS